jgi:translocation and assembly module TamB
VGVEPLDLARISADIPAVERAGGTLSASMSVTGPLMAPSLTGKAAVSHGELKLKAFPVSIGDLEIELDTDGGDLRLKRASARFGGGTVKATGRMPLRGPEAFLASANVTARAVTVPVTEGVALTGDADLAASYHFGPLGRDGADARLRNLLDVKGGIELTHFNYSGALSLKANLGQIGRASRREAASYDPESEFVRFDLDVTTPRPLHVTNELGEGDVEVMSPGLILSGTNQRPGARGLVRFLPDFKVELRGNEFLVREGYVRFDDPLKITPKLDVRAQTEYRRYASSSAPAQAGAGSSTEGSGASGSSSPVSAAASTSAAGIWRITLQLRGEIDNLERTLSSDPPLSQEDIVLLLAIGMTRAEIDRGGTSALGETVGLEALSALTGADRAVKTIVPLIDEFRFGTGYSSRTARSEPTVTVGKRIADRLHASVTTGVSENREVRSNVEWRLNHNVSVQGSYDNLNDVSSSPVGNVGVDLRWRLEFE